MEKRCDYCGKDFVPLSRKNRPNRFCSMTCYQKWRKENKVTFAKTNKTAKKCEYCGTFFIPRPSKPNRFCSTSCYFKFREENKTFDRTEYSHNYYLTKRDELSKTYKERHHFIRLKTLNILGGKCKRCGFSDFRALQIDHIKGDGSKDTRMGGGRYYKHILEMTEEDRNKKYQLLCANCNWIKRYENGEERRREHGV